MPECEATVASCVRGEYRTACNNLFHFTSWPHWVLTPSTVELGMWTYKENSSGVMG